MSLSTRIAMFLPYLRRFARAVTGSQTTGDGYVTALLEALIEDVALFPDVGNDRVQLYKLFIELFDKLNIPEKKWESPYLWEKNASEKFISIPEDPRKAFLLHALEEFTYDEISEILSVSVSDVERLIETASNEISAQLHTTILIIEDEPLIALDIQNMVEDLGHEVTGIARTHEEVMKLFDETQPKMILADIQLADGSSGLEAVNDILETIEIPVIFITAFPEKLLTGERPEPTFLVTKPFNPDMVKALITQALFLQQDAKLVQS
ncbi:MAG: response regulator [Rhizobiales bacterium]|nr:response regulator [Hyphomicrobiales bacterium]